MEEIQYIGEHLLPGQIGTFAIQAGFVSALLAAVAYFFATQKQGTTSASSWKNIGRVAFGVHGLAVFTTIGIIFYVMVNHYFEYNYVWSHVSEDLPFRYIFSAFWEGQEGSFLLWMFWHVILGFILMWRAKEWEMPVLSVLALVEAFLFSMILGIYIGEVKFGSNPLLLLRDTMDIPLFNNADYVSLIQGNGLNPLLQNYWMTIHPPTLFLGFASTVVPFCFAVAGLWTGKHKAWLKPAMSWALFSAAILGTGILMGGAWAYEALSFGGYWAWDPVENMSLVPWIVLVAGVHTHLIAKNTGYSIRATYLFYILTFLLILYSTFLTRSGVLGETSVHAFTEMGLENQLIVFILAFTAIGFVPFFIKYKGVPAPQKEEGSASKEFWMFIGSLVLLFSAAMITSSTSLPIYNKIREFFDPGFEGLTITDPVEHYNKYQLWIGVFMGLLSGIAQYLRYKEFNFAGYQKRISKHLGITLLLSVGMTFLTRFWIEANAWQYSLLMFSAYFTIFSNLDYLITIAKGNSKMFAGTFAHVGFGIMLIGVLASGLNKQHISTNPFAQRNLLEEELLDKNVLLFKEIPMFMSGYRVTYERDTMIGNERFFEVNYEKLDENGQVTEEFKVVPTATYNNKVTKVAAMNPSTKHYLDRDIFTHVANLPRKEYDFEFAKEQEDSLKYDVYDFKKNVPFVIRDTLQNNGIELAVETEAELLEIIPNASHPEYEPVEGDFTVGAKIAFRKKNPDTTFYAEPLLVVRGQLIYTYAEQLNDISMKVRLTEGILDYVVGNENDLQYSPFTMKEGEKINFNGQEIIFRGFNKQPEHPSYKEGDADIAVGADFLVAKEGTEYNAQPIYLIKGNRPFNLKDEIAELGLHFRFNAINPQDGTVEVLIAQKKPKDLPIPIQIAKKSLRTDYIVLEAIIFPGINLFWIGSIMMMVGLLVGMFMRKEKKLVSQNN